MFNNQIIAGSSGQGGGSFYSYNIDQSLRFDAASESELSRTFDSGGDRRKWTFSTWMKRSELTPSGNDDYIFGTNTGAADSTFMFLNWRAGDDLIVTGQSTLWLRSDRNFRDVSGWYHIVWSLDTDNATASQRMRLYINGSELTSFSTDSRSSLTGDQAINAAVEHNIGRHPTATGYGLGAYLAETHFVDGQALSPSDFGETINGIWVPKEVSGLTYGTNGFYLSFADSATIGCDKSGSKTLVTSTSFSTIGGGTTNFSQSEADKGFDNDKSTNVDRTGTSGLIEITPTSSVTPISHTMINANSTSYTAASRPNSVKLQGSNDGGSTWTDIDTLTNGSGANTETTSSFSNTTSYAKLRLNIASNHGGTNTRFSEYVVFASEDNGDGENIFFQDNLAASDVMTSESPTNNFATFNTLDKDLYNAPSEGGLRALTAGNNGTQAVNFAVSSGKWYFEVRNGTAGSASLARMVGIMYDYAKIAGASYNDANKFVYYSATGYIRNNSNVAYGDSWDADGDIIGVALDMDNGAIYFSKNGVWQNSATAAEIAAGTTTNAAFTGLSGTFKPIVAKTGGTSSNDPHDANFGQNPSFNGNLTGGDVGTEADDSGYGLFKYPVPSGFNCLATANLPEPAIGPNSTTTSDEHFNTVLWSGDGTTRSITGVGFQPDFCWHKGRNDTRRNMLYDSVRGATKVLITDSSNAEATATDTLTSFDSDGFSVGGNLNTNYSGKTYVGWNWKAGGTAVSNTDGSITSQVSANQDAGFSIVTYTGAGTGTVGHGLGITPSMYIVKCRSNAATNWRVYHSGIASDAETDYLTLDSNALAADLNFWNDTAPTDDVFSVFNYDDTGTSGRTYVAYVFADVVGFSKAGSYVGNGNADGPFIYTGFRPAWVMHKTVDTTANHWSIRDNKRDPDNEVLLALYANLTNADDTGGDAIAIDFLSNGFKPRRTNSQLNQSGTKYIYLAFAEAPFKYANAR